MERILLLLAILFSVQFVQARDPISDDKVLQIIDQFQYQSGYRLLHKDSNSSGWDNCWIFELEFETDYPGMTEPLVVKSQYYMPNREYLEDAKIPFVMMLPPMGGINTLDEFMAETFCEYNIASMIISNDFTGVQSGDVPPVEDHEMAFHRTVAGIKASMAFAKDDKNVNPDKMGIFGVSLGGVLGTFAMETLSEISVGYFLVAGGDVPNILAYSAQEEVTRIRKARMREENLQTREEYEDFLRVHISLDPYDLARVIPSEAINMVIATEDTRVPTKNQLDLHRALGSPEAIYRDQEHTNAIISTLLWGANRKDIARFYKRRFKLPNPRIGLEWLAQFDLNRY